MDSRKEIRGVNAGYLAELYDRFLENPDSVDARTRALFQQSAPPTENPAPPQSGNIQKIVGAVNLAESIRKFGHLDAHIDPLGSALPGDPSLRAGTYGLTDDDLRQLPASFLAGPPAEGAANAYEAIESLRQVYSSSIGYDYAHLRDPREREWLRDAAEAGRFRPPRVSIDGPALLERLTEVESLERFLHRTFPGKTRFSVEGLDMLIPVLDTVIAAAEEAQVRNVLIGMAHRARLNVLTHTLNKPYRQILAEFKDPVRARNFREDLGWTGDVKYHLGARRAATENCASCVIVSLPPNPSHLELVNPVVEGMARAAGTEADRPGPARFNPTKTLPLLIHGDASFSGQGVVAETLNFYRLPGYETGGTIHIVANNQLGYTTPPEESRSTFYAGEPARGFKIPIVHVNADDVEACIEVARLAFAYRARFQKDFVIDLVGYRRYGHNEGDEPSFTQPVMYKKIAGHPTVREQWAKTLRESGLIGAAWAEELIRRSMEKLQAELESLDLEQEAVESPPEAPPPGAARQARTAVAAGRLRALNQALLELPKDFAVNRKLVQARARRLRALDSLDDRAIDWAMAEELGFASILEEGIAIRMTGEDVERGTFGHRHAVFHDVSTDRIHIPLQALPQARAAFEVRNSPLTENAAIGFEYGYSMQEPGRLVIWEAQYGDFINGAQAMIDEFVVSARAKWGQTPSLVLLLPHGHEGQGPDHSSGRPERFLQLAAETNIRIANCTTAAQYFHLLRLQALLLTTDPLPLVILTPKSLLRHPLVFSSLRELAEGGWQRVIDDEEASRRAGQVHRLVLCSGKIYVDLVSIPERAESPSVALARVEQLYPFPTDEILSVLAGYPNLEEVVWVQEEPENMGAWDYARPYLGKMTDARGARLRYIGRLRSSSPSEGSTARHAINQRAIVERAYRSELRVSQEDMVLVKKT